MAQIPDNVAKSMADSLRDLIERLKTERTSIEAQVLTIDGKIKKVERELSQLGSLGKTDVSNGNGSRRPRGSNKEAVKQLFADNPKLASTAKDLASQLGIPRTSVQAVLSRLSNDFVELGADGLWRKKQ